MRTERLPDLQNANVDIKDLLANLEKGRLIRVSSFFKPNTLRNSMDESLNHTF